MKRTILMIAILLLSTAIFSQTFTKEQIVSDLKDLSEAISDFNPGLYKYNPHFDRKVDSLINTINGQVDKYEAYLLISQICAFSNEGHFEIGQWTDSVHESILADESPFLPFSVFVVENRIYINGDYTKDGILERGAEVKKINEYESAEIISILRSATPSDGAIQTYQRKKIEDNFPWFYFFYIEQTKSFDLVLNTDEGEKKVTINALTRIDRINNAKSRNDSPAKEPSIDDVFELKVQEEYSYLQLKSFDFRLIEKYNLKGDDFYQEIFDKIHNNGSNTLIIDLRGNTGGRNEFAEDIVPFIRKEDFAIPYLIRSTSWKGKVKTAKLKKASKDSYNVAIYVLVDGYTYSVGGIIARYLRELNGATFIGEETGMRYEGFVAGSKQYTTLANTNIRIGVPCYLKEFPESSIQQTKNKGLMPDYTIKVTIDDRLNENDPVMDFALDLIEENKQ